MNAVSPANSPVSTPGESHQCFHCGERIPANVNITVMINGQEQQMCCQGCRAVAMAINDSGLADYYRYRSVLPPRPETGEEKNTDSFRIYDDPLLQKDFVSTVESGQCEAGLIMEGMVCPACAWLNETHLATLPGMTRASVNFAAGKAQLQWDPDKTCFSEILASIHKLGYRGYPYKPGLRESLREQEKKSLLMRLGLAGLLGMQVMMIAIALYAGDWQWMEAEHRHFLRWVSLVLTTPIMLFPAQPFFANGWRALRNRRLEMDVAIALGISIAFIASLVATIRGSGTVYFDSVAMLVFFLLVGRYLEFSARNRAGSHLDKLEKIIPAVITRLDKYPFDYDGYEVPVNQVQVDDILLIKPGETVPVDGIVMAGDSSLDEAIITGESAPVLHGPDDHVCSGSTNIDSPLYLKVTATGSNTTYSRICRLIEKAQSEKPPVALLIDRIASWFIGGVLLVAAGAAWYWWQVDKSMWVPVTIATLVVTCPCALSLATPVSITVATNRLFKLGLALVRSGALQVIAGITHMVFDKTGTLTEGKLRITRVTPLADLPEEKVLALAMSLEAHSEHPIAKAFRDYITGDIINTASDIRNHPGEGISGTIENSKYFIGTAEFICNRMTSPDATLRDTTVEFNHCIFLADENRPLAAFYLEDQVRTDARKVVDFFNTHHIETMILSGDNETAVKRLAEETGAGQALSRYKPDGKLAVIEQLQAKGAVVAMVGDGINDAPVLARADVSIAMGSGTDLTQLNADMVLIGSGLTGIIDGYLTSRRCMTIIRQNILWAIIYNVIALPAAVCGLIAPWMAALGMSASSLLVVLNSLRINKRIGISSKWKQAIH